MRIRVLQDIEDLAEQPEPDGKGGYKLVPNIIRAKEGAVIEAPDPQAQNLIDLGYAEVVEGDPE